jgi:hypothetical protein
MMDDTSRHIDATASEESAPTIVSWCSRSPGAFCLLASVQGLHPLASGIARRQPLKLPCQLVSHIRSQRFSSQILIEANPSRFMIIDANLTFCVTPALNLTKFVSMLFQLLPF